MTRKQQVKLIQEGDYIAQVDVELIYTDEGWSPYLSLADDLISHRRSLGAEPPS